MKTLTATEIWHLALTDSVAINATTREVWAREEGEDVVGWHTVGVLAEGVSVEDAEAEIAEAYAK